MKRENIKYRQAYFSLLLAIINVIVYISFCGYFSMNSDFHGDTIEYMHNFNEIHQYPFPYGVEVLTPIIMWVVSFLGGDFRDFIFVCLVIWTPIVFLLGLYSRSNFLFIGVYFYFLTPLFINNAVFLIRQYNAAFFYIFFLLYSNRKDTTKSVSFGLLLLAFLSHLSSVFWFVISNKITIKFFKNRVIFFIVFSPLILLALSGVDIISWVVDLMFNISNLLDFSEINRKLMFYRSSEYEAVSKVNNLAELIAFSLLFFSGYLFLLSKKNDGFYFFVFSQALLVVLLKDNIVMANRFGFFAFYFSIPILMALIYLFKKLELEKGER
ncbi:TPA: EpsG family protein [Aeromonas dhakensis]|nr:EpsG family protein [Aeromonas dhakensis]